ncbi:hypothetical protein [Streptomyces sp. NPDC001787]|uniref:hypothetical protein n=1 Tax=Streptomyces sp. NPDC001787 TaxID=3154523 RepID=UPI00331C811D
MSLVLLCLVRLAAQAGGRKNMWFPHDLNARDPPTIPATAGRQPGDQYDRNTTPVDNFRARPVRPGSMAG